MLVWSSRKHVNMGGDGWSAYNRLFRQHAAANPDLPWATLDGSIHAATFLASRREWAPTADCVQIQTILPMNVPSLQCLTHHSQPSMWQVNPLTVRPGQATHPTRPPVPSAIHGIGGNAHMHLSAATDISAPHARRALTRRKTVPTLRPTASSAGLLHHLAKAAGRTEPDRYTKCGIYRAWSAPIYLHIISCTPSRCHLTGLNYCC